MKISAKLLAVFVWAGLGWMAVSASADTLQMKDGRVIQGRFFGGTQASVQFETNGKIELYNLDDIISVTFTNAPPASSAPPAAPSAPPSSATFPPPPRAYQPPAPTPTAAPNATSITVPAGADFLVRMIDSVDSDKNHIGDRFRASLEQDFVVDDTVIAPKGSDVYGRLSEAKEAGHIQGKSQLKLELTDILIRNRLQPIMTGDYEVSGSSRGSDTAKKVGNRRRGRHCHRSDRRRGQGSGNRGRRGSGCGRCRASDDQRRTSARAERNAPRFSDRAALFGVHALIVN